MKMVTGANTGFASGGGVDRYSISKSTSAQSPYPRGEGWGEVEEAAPPPRLVPGAPEKHRQEVVIAGSMRDNKDKVLRLGAKKQRVPSDCLCLGRNGRDAKLHPVQLNLLILSSINPKVLLILVESSDPRMHFLNPK